MVARSIQSMTFNILFPAATGVFAQTALLARFSLTAVATTSKFQDILANLTISWPWYITRGAGIVAACLLILLMLSGIGQITGFTYRILEPLTAWRIHRALGISFCIAGGVHVLPLLVDKFVPFTVFQILFPFLSPYAPITIFGISLGSFGVALGIFSMYSGAAVVLSSLYWIDKSPFWWRVIHYLSYLLIIMVLLHGLLVGTDLKTGIMRTLWLLAGAVMVLAILSRLRRAHTLDGGKQEGGGQ